MEQLIPVAAKVQDVLGALGESTSLDLPQIVVVGGQSSGKSSVLEAVVGRSFLPRGSGIVTRRPLILQLFATERREEKEAKNEEEEDAENNDDSSEWGEFAHLPGRRFSDFSLVREEIIAETERLTGRNKGVSSTPIRLKVYSPRVLNLTLVDLPGMAKVAVGDQPEDIESRIRSMCLEYASNPHAIVLAVTAGNTDLANSDALQLARAVDPRGDRTVGVITKLDLMDPGTDAAALLANEVVPLRRGYVGVCNRGQRDVENDVSVRDGLRKEARFFRSHPAYRSVPDKCGVPNLARTLNAMLMRHIKDCLPDLKAKIARMMHDLDDELRALGGGASSLSAVDSTASQAGTLLSLLSKFTVNFSDRIDGRGDNHHNLHHSANTNTSSTSSHHVSELHGGARISFIFHKVFVRSLLDVRPFDGLSDDEIRTTICNANGTRAALFVPEVSFDLLVRRQIARLEQPGLQCVDMVYDELRRMAVQAEPPEMARFPRLRERVAEVVAALLRKCVGPTQLMVSNLVKIELAYVNTSHPDFVGGSRAVARLMADEYETHKHNNHNKRNRGRTTDVNGNRNRRRDHDDDDDDYEEDDDNDNDDDDDNHKDTTKDPTEVLDDVVIHDQSVPPGQDDQQGGSLMNYLFRGKNQNASSSVHRPTSSSRGAPAASHDTTTTTTPSRPQTSSSSSSSSPRQRSFPPSVVRLPRVPDTMLQTDVPTDRERVETEIIKSLLTSYFSIVRKNFIDMVPKTIMYFLVNHCKDALQNQLVKELYKDDLVPVMMREAEDVANRRRTCAEMRELLGRALEIVDEVRDASAS